MPPAAVAGAAAAAAKAMRDTIFLIKASPIDDEFSLWLAPKLEAEGFRVFADILTLQPGDRWRRQINEALQYRAVKVLLICRDATLADRHVQDDLDIALELSKELDDSRFIIPLRLEPGKKVKGVGDAVTVDFVRGWGEGVGLLLDALKRQKVPRPTGQPVIDPNWEIFRRRVRSHSSRKPND
jgi:TIR domain